jgi:hypothetical protein
MRIGQQFYVMSQLGFYALFRRGKFIPNLVTGQAAKPTMCATVASKRKALSTQVFYLFPVQQRRPGLFPITLLTYAVGYQENCSRESIAAKDWIGLCEEVLVSIVKRKRKGLGRPTTFIT